MYDKEIKNTMERKKGHKTINNPLGLTKEELRLLEQINELKELATTPSARKAYEEVIFMINLNALTRNRKIF